MMIKLLSIAFLFLSVLFSCSKKHENKMKARLFTFEELNQIKTYKNLDSLPKNLDSVYKLDLSDAKLTKLPEIVLKCSNLQELDISRNQISELKGIEKLQNLQIINLGMNEFTVFPIELTKLQHLKSLDLWWNDIQTFPDAFFKNNTQIEYLHMASMFAFDFQTNLKKIHLLKNLKSLGLGNNQIPNLTIQFDKLNNLEEFAYIRQESINVKQLCIQLSKCKRLKTIHLSVNKIQVLPREITLLENLETLNLFQNELQELPTEIIQMQKLKKITLIDNPIHKTKMERIENKMKQTKIIY